VAGALHTRLIAPMRAVSSISSEGDVTESPTQNRPFCRDAEPLILLADDDPLLRACLSKQLAALGCAVLESADGRAAVGQARAYAGTLALALLDVQMPALNGYQAARAIRALAPTLPIALMSGGNIATDQTVADMTLSKPLSLGDLRALLARLGLVRLNALENIARIAVQVDSAVLADMQAEAERQGRGLSDLVQEAWRLVRDEIRTDAHRGAPQSSWSLGAQGGGGSRAPSLPILTHDPPTGARDVLGQEEEELLLSLRRARGDSG
jgi:CheY-like chemotaxis protein